MFQELCRRPKSLLNKKITYVNHLQNTLIELLDAINFYLNS